MQFFCRVCSKAVTNEVPNTVTIRAFVECPECFKAESKVRRNSIHVELNMKLADRLTLSKDALVGIKAAFFRAELSGFTSLTNQSPDKALTECIQSLCSEILTLTNKALQELV